MGFYEEIAEEYDEMVNFERRLETATSFSRKLARRCRAHTACDVACGTGLYALALARAGLQQVTGSDLSESMLGVARRRSEQLELPVKWVLCDMQDSGTALPGPYDLIVCLGNSIPHLLTANALRKTLDGFHRQLCAGGHCAIQILNYGQILTQQDRIVDITRSEDGRTEFLRFYDFLNQTISFNLLTVHWNGRDASHTMQSTELYPYRAGELQDALRDQGFGDFELYGGPTFVPYDPEKSASLLLIARRS